MHCRTSLPIAKTIGGSAPRRDLSRPRLQLFVPHARPPLYPLPSSLSYPFHLSLFRRSRFLASPPFFSNYRSPPRSPSRMHERGPPSIASIRSNKCSLVYTVDLLECLGIRLSNARDNDSTKAPVGVDTNSPNIQLDF